MSKQVGDQREFMANIAHELKTPIGAMALLAEALAAETSPDTREALTRRLCEEARRAATIVDDLISMGTKGENARRTTVSNARRLAEDTVERLSEAAVLRDVAIEVEGSESLHVRAEPVEAMSALYHLIENALEHSPQGSTISVDVGGDETSCAFAVKDSGDGLEVTNIDRLFERFYSGENAKDGLASGTGLGLAIAKQAAQRNGGDISVDAQPGVGSTFTLKLQGDSGE
jgi:two-component system, OmpR family, sensor histidine kinase SenX3